MSRTWSGRMRVRGTWGGYCLMKQQVTPWLQNVLLLNPLEKSHHGALHVCNILLRGMT